MTTPLDPTLESALAGARRRFHWLRFWRYLAVAGFAAVGAVLVAGVAMERGWLVRPGVALGLLLVLVALAVLALPVIVVAALAPQRSREWSARHVEDANPSLLDRLNTLVFLRPRRGDPVLASYGRRIERQAVREMLFAARPFEDEKRRLSRRWLGLLLLVLATVFFYDHFRPWQNLRERPAWEGHDADVEGPLLEDPIADAEELQAERPEPAWGEVRITEPGRDVKVTKVDVVPLQIEAAASQALESARWVTTPTGAEPREHPLPAPEEPRFAVYRPHLYVDELRLADWDVASYYAAAATAAEDYASEIYFIEVRPFREEIEKLMESGGQGASLMNQCTGLIERQKHVLRQTHRFLARPADDEEVRAQDQEKLVTAEAELAEATRHLYARMAAELENQAIANVLDRLAAAGEELERATAALRASPPTAPEPEQSALAELVATRKDLQRAISENPSAFGGEPSAEEPFPIAEELERISEFRDEEQAALELLDEVLEEQREIAEEIAGNPGRVSQLAPRHEASRRRLEQLEDDHPRLFDGAREEAERADEALRSAHEALGQWDPDLAGERQAEAITALEELREAVAEQTLARQLGDAYKLKKLLDRQAEEMGEMASNPGATSQGEAARAAGEARETTRELKEMMEQSPVGQGFGPELRDALADRRQQSLERDLDALAEAEDEAARGRAAEAAKEGLEAISDAFEQSAPRTVRELRAEDALTPGDAESLENALRQLEALLGVSGGDRSRADVDALRREALDNLRHGLEGLDGDRERVAALLDDAEEALERDDAVDEAKLRRLLAELRQLSSELGGAEIEELELDLAHIDPAELPAEYRERIQSYFKKLSERR